MKLVVSIFAFVTLIGALLIADRPGGIQPQEFEFSQKLKAHLSKVGDSEAVSVLHQGDWSKVCVTSGGFDQDLRIFGGEDRDAVEVMNNVSPFITDRNDESAVIFVHREGRIEVFRMTPRHTKYTLEDESGQSCFSKEDAVLKVFHTYQNVSEENKALDIKDKDFIWFVLTENKED